VSTPFFEYIAGDEPDTPRALQLEVTPANKQALAYYQRLGFKPSKLTWLIKNLNVSSQ
jgi:ribosomal protein S18 acetylase RimI-like enzyme